MVKTLLSAASLRSVAFGSSLTVLALFSIQGCSEDAGASDAAGGEQASGGQSNGGQPGGGTTGTGGDNVASGGESTGGATADGGTGQGGESSQTGTALDGFGTISGTCGVLDSELTSTSSYLFRNAIDFGELELDETLLSAGGKEMLAEGNLGGNSLYSEIFAFEMLHRCELADYLKSEGEVLYDDVGGKKTDILVSIDGLTIGVSVVRAYHYPPTEPYPADEAYEKLEEKLSDILLSTENVAPQDQWTKQILHVIAYSSENADAIEEAYAAMDDSIKADTIVMVTVTDGEDEYIY